MFCRLFVIVFYLTTTTSYAQFEGESCLQGSVQGTCTNIRKCPSAIEDIRNRKNPQICTFDGNDPVVCCVGSTPSTTQAPRPAATPVPTPKQTTTEYIPPVYDYVFQDQKEECGPVSQSLTAPKTGQKAWDKCIEYQERFIFPCEKTAALTGGKSRGQYCFHSADQLIVGGTAATIGEFTHMVLLGFGDDSATAQWSCGGTLLSEWFILTAGHCTWSREFGAVTYAILGILRRSANVDSSKLYKIKRIIKHPDYKPPSKYNDIALLETETQMKLGPYAVPACLDVGKETKYDKAAATGWGTLAYGGSTSDTLQKVTLNQFSEEECSKHFLDIRHMKNGLNGSSQICYGDYTQSKDACQGDSGGPLQVQNSHMYCMYTVIGVTSFGRKCGEVGVPGIYTKVETFVPWIESIVWA